MYIIFLLLNVLIISIRCKDRLHIYHITDDHSWLFGHEHLPELDVGLGELVSFIERAKALHNSEGDDCLFLDSGDFIQGTGLSDKVEPFGKNVFEIMRKLPYDGFTLGNHDLTVAGETAEVLLPSFVDSYGSRALTFNIFVRDPQTNIVTHIGESYKVLESAITKRRFLITGVIYDMNNLPAGMFTTPATEMTKTSEFERIMNEKFDVFVLLLHIGYNMSVSTYDEIYESLRIKLGPNMPIIMLGGHEHQWYQVYPYSVSHKTSDEMFVNDTNTLFIESDCFFQTVGYINIALNKDGKIDEKSVQIQAVSNSVANLKALINLSDKDELMTEKGLAYKAEVDKRVEELELDVIIGVAPHYYSYHNPNIHDKNSEWNLWLFDIIPKTVLDADDYPKKKEHVYISVSSILENDIYEGNVTLNDLFVTMPFQLEWFTAFRAVDGKTIKKVYCEINDMTYPCNTFEPSTDSELRGPPGFPKYFMVPLLEELADDKLYDLVSTDYDEIRITKAFNDMKIEYKKMERISKEQTPFLAYTQYVKKYWN